MSQLRVGQVLECHANGSRWRVMHQLPGRARRQRLIARTVVFTFMSIGVLSLSIQDLHHAKEPLKNPIEWLQISA